MGQRSSSSRLWRLWGPRLAFAALLVVGGGQVLVDHYSSEPYPGLFQPGFAGAGRYQGTVVPMVVHEVAVTYVDGSTSTFEGDELLAASEVSRARVFNTAFRDDGRAGDPRTQAWLADRLTDLGDGVAPRSATLSWVRWEHDVVDRSARRVRVDHTRSYTFEGSS